MVVAERSEGRPFIPSKLAEGKTKIIWETEDPSVVRIENKDDITAGDGLRRDIISGKSQIATETTSNVFTLLNRKGVVTHFVGQDSLTSFVARSATMIPLECVARRIAAGSYLKRHPEVAEGQRFETPPVEFYLKDDSRHDPMIQVNRSTGVVLLFDAKVPVEEQEPIGQMTLDDLDVSVEELDVIEEETKKTFEVIETAWAEQGVDLVDMKVEFGKDVNQSVMLADVIDNDSWRIWPGGDKSRMLDKQRYRDGGELSSILKDYSQVAEMTRAFVN